MHYLPRHLILFFLMLSLGLVSAFIGFVLGLSGKASAIMFMVIALLLLLSFLLQWLCSERKRRIEEDYMEKNR